MTTIPFSWIETGPIEINDVKCFKRTYSPDGIDVIISIRFYGHNHTVWSNAEHRTSGPYINLIGENNSFNEALNTAIIEMNSWDIHMKKITRNP